MSFGPLHDTLQAGAFIPPVPTCELIWVVLFGNQLQVHFYNVPTQAGHLLRGQIWESLIYITLQIWPKPSQHRCQYDHHRDQHLKDPGYIISESIFFILVGHASIQSSRLCRHPECCLPHWIMTIRTWSLLYCILDTLYLQDNVATATLWRFLEKDLTHSGGIGQVIHPLPTVIAL